MWRAEENDSEPFIHRLTACGRFRVDTLFRTVQCGAKPILASGLVEPLPGFASDFAPRQSADSGHFQPAISRIAGLEGDPVCRDSNDSTYIENQLRSGKNIK